MVAGGILALLVAATIGNTSRTDGFFAAYGVYSLCVLFAQSARTTIVARIIDDGDPMTGFNGFLGAGLMIFAVLGIVLVALGGPVAGLITGSLPTAASDTARTALLILWPAVAGQLFASLGAARLALRGSFGVPAVAFGSGGLLSIIAFVVLQPELHIDAVAVAILVGSYVSAAITAVAVWQAGWRPSRSIVLDLPGNARRARLLLVASISLLLAHLSYLITLAVGAHLGQGVVTDYSYAYAGVLLITAVLSSSASIVLAGALASSWDRRPETLRPHHLRVFSFGILLLAPCVAAVALIGIDVGYVVLAKFSHHNVRRTIEFFLVLCPAIVGAMALAIPETALYTLGRYRAAALRSIGILALQAAICILAWALGNVWLLAAALSITSAFSVLVLLVLIYGEATITVTRELLRALARVVAVAAVAFGVPGLAALAAGGGTGARAAALVIGVILFAFGVRAFLPVERALAAELVRSLSASLAAALQRGAAAVP
jgi:peptidoglycan biosynthesis protein MviN/MurJ (putative lipid II flippase)